MINLVEPKKIIGYLFKKIIRYWVQHKRKKSQIEKYSLKLKPTVLSEKINSNDNRERPKVDLAVCS